MTEHRTPQVRLGSLVRWVLVPVVCIAAFGAWPTWLVYEGPGLWAQGAAVSVVLIVMLGSGVVTVYAARQGAGMASTTFLGCSLLRMLLCPGLLGLVWLATEWPVGPMSVWLIITYLACLALEVVWFVRALRAGSMASKTDASTE